MTPDLLIDGIFGILEETRKLEELRVENNVESLTELIKDLHVYLDFHGNRSPVADPRMQGSIVGLSLKSSLSSLALSYSATLHAIVLQTKHIIDSDTMNSKGHHISSIYMSGFGVCYVGNEASKAGAKGREGQAERMWDITVEMTPVGTLIPLKATNKGKKLLESKYGISWKLLRSRRGGGKRWKMLQMKSSPNMTNNVNSIYP